MSTQRKKTLTQQELEKAILAERRKGTSDIEIGNKYGVSLRFIEKVVTKAAGVNVSAIRTNKKTKTLHPSDFKEERTTVWSFKSRGSWATHSGEYRGNWSPYIPRNVILKYSKPGETVLDYFCGAGTTAVEAKLLGRKCIASDINEDAIVLAKQNLDFKVDKSQLRFVDDEEDFKIYEPELTIGDARNLSKLGRNSVHLICAHPPYANIINYTHGTEGDLSFCDIDPFLKEMEEVAKESYRTLKPGRQCAILIGDTRRKKHVIPLGFMLIDVYLKAGFRLRELVIKRQHNCKTTGFWYANSIKYNFLLLAHEYLPVFEKPKKPLSIGEKQAKEAYEDIATVIVRPQTKKGFKDFETTTVWIFPEKDFERSVDNNVIHRYYRERGKRIVHLTSKPNDAAVKRREKRNSLVYVKSLTLDGVKSGGDVNRYLKELQAEINREIPYLDRGGYLVIQAQDVRIDGYIEPVAKRILDMIKNESLSIKEVVVATTNDNSSKQSDGDFLEISHKYLLVYKVS